MNLAFNTIRVKDMAASLKFYQEVLGLPLVRQFQAGPNQIAFLAAGGAELELIYGPESAGSVPGTNLSMGFAVESLDEVMSRLEQAGIPLYSGPVSPAPVIRFVLVKDPDGVLVQLSEHLEG